MSKTKTNRLTSRPGEHIDRESSIDFEFDGKGYQAFQGDTIASALTAEGVKVFSRSFKYHRPRGLLCCSGDCPNCLVQVGDEPNVRACTRQVEPGMKVTAQNAWPSLKRDIMSLTKLGGRFLPPGFYYKAFIRPKFLWPTFERMLRKAAGLGSVNPDTAVGQSDKQYLHADVVVVGGGPAGISAALAALDAGAKVLLIDENASLGGHLRFASTRKGLPLARLIEKIQQAATLTTLLNTTVLGWYEENWLSAARDNQLFKIRAGSVIFATGAYEQPLLFDNNDLPGVMLGSGLQRLLNLYGVTPGHKAVIITANDDGWNVAADLQAAGVEVVAVVDERRPINSPLIPQASPDGIETYWSHTIMAAAGSGKVDKAIIVQLDDHGQIIPESKKEIRCDLITVSVGWAPANGLIYQANGKMAFDRNKAEFLPHSLPKGIYAAGHVAGTDRLSFQIQEGAFAGQEAAAYLGIGDNPPDEDMIKIREGNKAEPRRTSNLVHVPGKKKQFLCYCEDVTKKDLDISLAEGYDSIELLKRYSTISMGPCQGRMCSANTIHLCARANDRTVEETGTTTARPPMAPVSLATLAGQKLEPVRNSAIHRWHVDHGAKMMVAGLWLRPEHYGDPQDEVEGVRNRVGLIDVSTLGKFRLRGSGIPNLLDRIYVNKWQKLAIGSVRYGLMCNDEGIILDDGVTARVADEEWYMTTTSGGAASIFEWLQWWMQSGWGSDAALSDVSEMFAAYNLAGPEARNLLETLTTADISNTAFPYMHHQRLNIAGVDCRVIRIGFTGELSYEIHCPTSYGTYMWETLMNAGEPYGISPFGIEAQRILRLEKAHIIVGHDTDALSDPISADMAWAVKLDKDDFLGQRSLARIDGEGPAQRLVGFKVGEGRIPEEGLQIVEKVRGERMKIIGWVTSSRYSPTLKEGIGLCWLPAAIAETEGAAFTIYREGSLTTAHVHHGSFYDKKGERLRT